MPDCIHAYHVTARNGEHERWVCFNAGLRGIAPNCQACPQFTPVGSVKPRVVDETSEKQKRKANRKRAARMERRAQRITNHPRCDSDQPPVGAFSSSERTWLGKLGIKTH